MASGGKIHPPSLPSALLVHYAPLSPCTLHHAPGSSPAPAHHAALTSALRGAGAAGRPLAYGPIPPRTVGLGSIRKGWLQRYHLLNCLLKLPCFNSSFTQEPHSSILEASFRTTSICFALVFHRLSTIKFFYIRQQNTQENVPKSNKN